jgi:Transglycosylase SLT domain
MRVARVVLGAFLVASPCSGPGHGRTAVQVGAPRPQVHTSTPVSPSPSVIGPPAARFLPDPDQAIPKDPGVLAGALAHVTGALQGSIDRWRSATNALNRPPRDVVLQALYQQRICRTLAADPRLAAVTLPRLRGAARLVAGTAVDASSLFHGLVRPVSNPRSFTTGPAEPAGVLLRHYREAQRKFGVRWEVLAALNYIESKFGRVRSASLAGARGPMQFITSTWAVYGMGGNINDPHDAIMGAANYLHRSGAPRDDRGALFAYNHAWSYVEGVLLYARMIERDIRNYFALYNWQVYVLTTTGSKRLTGPGPG